MKKKKKPVQVDIKALQRLIKSVSHFSKSQKVKVRNVFAATMAVVLVVGIFASIPQIRNYFSSQPSKASELGGVNPIVPSGWTGTPVDPNLAPWGKGPSDQPCPFNLVINPLQQTVMAGEQAVYQVTAIRELGCIANISLSTNVLSYYPKVISAKFLPDVLTLAQNTSILTIGTNVVSENYQAFFYVRGKAGITTKFVTASLKIIAQPWQPEGNSKQIISPSAHSAKIHNNKVVYIKEVQISENPALFDRDIYVNDLKNGITIPISTHDKNKSDPDIYDHIVVWSDNRNGGGSCSASDIYMYDLLTQEETNITNNPCGLASQMPAIYGDTIVWRDFTWPDSIKMYNIQTGETSVIAPAVYGIARMYPAIEGKVIVWMNKNYLSGGGFGYGGEIYMYNIETGVGSVVSPQPNSNQTLPDIYGNWIIWQESRNSNDRIYLYDLSLGQEFQISLDYNGIAQRPAIYRGIIVWDTLDDVWMHKISNPVGINYNLTGNEYPPAGPWHYKADIFANKIIWEQNTGYAEGNAIYLYELTN